MAYSSDEASSTNTNIPSTQATKKTNPPPEDWELRWLKGIPCKPPCFEGVTPGISTAKEAQEILLKNPNISSAVIYSDSKRSNNLLMWTWKAPLPAGNGGEIYFDDKFSNYLIHRIIPHFQHTFSLAEIMAYLGSPTHVLGDIKLGIDYPGAHYTLTLLYLPLGIELDYRTYSKDGTGKPVLSPDMTFGRISFVKPPSAESLADGLGRMVPWQGYKDFDFYCRDPDAAGDKDCSKITPRA